MVSVKTDRAVPKDKIFEVMAAIRESAVCAPVRIGDVIIADLFGANIIATKDID
jgi:CxxC motif-containing protein